MRNILRQLHQKPIAYYPVYRQLTGSTTGGILLSQLMYWFAKKDKIFKTDNEIMEETFLSEKELRNAKKLIKNLEFVTVSREGIPAKTYYKIDWTKFEKVLNKISPKGETVTDQRAKHSTTKGRNCYRPKGETNIVKSLTENTTEITTETTTDINTSLPPKAKKSKIKEQTEQKISEATNLNQEAFREWLSYKNYKNIVGVTKSINFLTKFDMQTQQAIIDQSLMNEWQGLFELKKQAYQPTQPQQPFFDESPWDDDDYIAPDPLKEHLMRVGA